MIHADFETRSAADLLKVGAHVYATHPTTDINCLGWAVADEPVELWLLGDPPPSYLLERLDAGDMIAAWNAQFERLIWNNILVRYGFPPLPIERFYCVAALSRCRGYPGSLDKAARFAELPIHKDMEGHHLMLKLCKPRRIELDGTIVWWDYDDDYLRLGEYCKTDVEVERLMFKHFIPLTPEELSDFHLAEHINDRGVMVDLELARIAVDSAADEKLSANECIDALTNGAVTAFTQVQRLSEWVAEEWKPLPDMGKVTVRDALAEPDIPPVVAEVLELRLDNAKSAVSKFDAMLQRSDAGGTVRGLYIFHGTGPGRFSSTGVQIQNLMRNSCLEGIPLLKKRGLAGLRLLGDPVLLLAQMVRPTFIAAPGRTFVIGDFAQIQARVTAWLACETKLLELFSSGKDAYCAFGTVAYGRLITKADEIERFVSKGCVLGLGFGGAEGALARTLKTQGNLVLPEARLTHFVKTYRTTYPRIKAYWYVLRDAALAAMYSNGCMVNAGAIAYLFDGQHLWCRLPSGRLMCYPYARVVTDDWGDSVEFRRASRNPKSGVLEWPVERLWYGLQMENIAQAIEFDLLMLAIRKLRKYDVRIHVHDELVIEVDEDKAEEFLPRFLSTMAEGAPWSAGLPIKAEGGISKRYRHL